jgi:large subunit ribosomal protein L1
LILGGKASKRYRALAEAIDQSKLYGLDEAMELVSSGEPGGFDESVDIAIRLGVDPKHADQMVRGAVVLPNGTGKSTRILVFAKGDKEKEATDAGADYVGGDDLAKKIQSEGWLDFERVIATPDMMSVVGRLGKILGPRGLMPNPKLGTVTFEVGQAVSEQKAGKVEFRVDKTGIIHTSIGKKSFEAGQLLENAKVILDMVIKAKPAASKGIYLKKVSVSTTMGPGIRIDPASVSSKAA